MNRVAIKTMAKERIKGKIITYAMALIALTLVSSLFGAAIQPFGGIAKGVSILATMFILNVGTYGIVFMGLKAARGEDIEFSDLLVGCSNYWKVVLLYFFIELFTTLWSLLFLIPGIIAAISYSFAPYILMDNPDMEPLDAIKLSKNMTNGYKAELAVLYISFFGWLLLAGITFGIALFWVYPYMEASRALYYEALKNNINYSEVLEGDVIE